MQFDYFGKRLNGFNHLYNLTHLNERQVELAVAFDFLAGRGFGCGLEVGNVLGHYEVGGHLVVDRYEGASMLQYLQHWTVLERDLFDIDHDDLCLGGADWIVSISTIEHVGWDMDPDSQDETLAPKAITHLRSLLAPDGKMLVTMPTGHHPLIDDMIREDLTGATRSCTIVRSGERWVQTQQPEVWPYAMSTAWAESVWIGEFDPID